MSASESSEGTATRRETGAGRAGPGLRGVWGRPYIDLEPFLDLAGLDAVHDEVCLGLAKVPASYTGGCHKWMGIMPGAFADNDYVDYGHVLERMTDAERRTFISLSDAPDEFGPEDAEDFGEEREHTLTKRQMLWLKHRFGVYFPWQMYLEMIPNHYWDEKSRSEGKRFTREARAFFPKTIELVRSLPFEQIGRCNIMGLDPNHDGTVHRDGDPDEKPVVDHFITLCPGGNKRLFLWDEVAGRKTVVAGRAYWFNDSDFHGVESDPWFRYSIRVDGVFRRDFFEQLERQFDTNGPERSSAAE